MSKNQSRFVNIIMMLKQKFKNFSVSLGLWSDSDKVKSFDFYLICLINLIYKTNC